MLLPLGLSLGLSWVQKAVRRPEFESWLHLLAEHGWASMFIYQAWNDNNKCLEGNQKH